MVKITQKEFERRTKKIPRERIQIFIEMKAHVVLTVQKYIGIDEDAADEWFRYWLDPDISGETGPGVWYDHPYYKGYKTLNNPKSKILFVKAKTRDVKGYGKIDIYHRYKILSEKEYKKQLEALQ